MERTTLSRNLTLLEGKDWISINAGEDPRARMIGITAQGRGARPPRVSLLVEGAGAYRQDAGRRR